MSDSLRDTQNEEAQELAELLATIVMSIVDFPDGVNVSFGRGSHTITIEFETHDDDVGHVLGKGRENWAAILRLVTAAARARDLRVRVEYINLR